VQETTAESARTLSALKSEVGGYTQQLERLREEARTAGARETALKASLMEMTRGGESAGHTATQQQGRLTLELTKTQV
jgi:hypothetical protein